MDHNLTNSPEKLIQSGVIQMTLSDHELIYCTRKTSLLKLNENYEISIRAIKFPDNSNYSWVKDVCQYLKRSFYLTSKI